MSNGTESPVVFPIPQEMEFSGDQFQLNESSPIVVPEKPSDQDLSLARFLVAEISDRYGLGLKIKRLASLPSDGNYILMGSIANPLVKECCEQKQLDITSEKPGPEGYVLQVQGNMILIAGSDDVGAFYGLQSLRQLPEKEGTEARIPGVQIRDWPHLPFRGVRLFLPGNENIPFFKRFLRDFVALYKYNKLIIEVNACMRLDQHPELNAGSVEFAKDLNYRRNNYPEKLNRTRQNSAHQDTADGEILEKEQIADIVEYANRHFIEVIPEIPSLTHSYYLLSRHRELAEHPEHRWPDTYCPLKPESYELLFEVMDEYIDVMKPQMIHIGHDEWFLATELLCPTCKMHDRPELFAQDVNRIHAYLKDKGIRVAMWGDHLMKSVRGENALSEDRVRALIPKDILIFNWFWHGRRDDQGGDERRSGEFNDIKLEEMGFQQIYGNFAPYIENWPERSIRDSVIGGAPSSWTATTEPNFGRDLMHQFLGCANLLWSKHWPDSHKLWTMVRGMSSQIRQNLRGRSEPSEDGDPVVPIDIADRLNIMADEKVMDQDILSRLATGELRVGNKIFHLVEPGAIIVGSEGEEKNPLPREVSGIKIGRDVSSLIFLHACAKPAQKMMAYHEIYNTSDTAELLGWYEIVYEDGLVETLPLRYGENILDWSGQGLYGADTLNCAASDSSTPIYFFALEWPNPRLGRRIREINLKGSTGFRKCRTWHGVSDELVPSNALILLALSVVESRKGDDSPR